MEQVYFEAGKIVASATRLLFLSGAILFILVLGLNEGEVLVPFVKVSLNAMWTIVASVTIHIALFARFLAAVNYERELRDRVRNREGDNEKVWLLSYPSIYNFQQFSNEFMTRHDHQILYGNIKLFYSIIGVLLPLVAFIKVVWLCFYDALSLRSEFFIELVPSVGKKLAPLFMEYSPFIVMITLFLVVCWGYQLNSSLAAPPERE